MRDHDLPFPFNIRRASACGNSCSSTASRSSRTPRKSAQWNRGAYLVNGPGHCAECHSPRNFLGGIKSGQRFAGGPNPEGRAGFPTSPRQAARIGRRHDFADLLETGDMPDGDPVGGTWRRSSATPRSFAEPTARRWRSISSRCRRRGSGPGNRPPKNRIAGLARLRAIMSAASRACPVNCDDIRARRL